MSMSVLPNNRVVATLFALRFDIKFPLNENGPAVIREVKPSRLILVFTIREGQIKNSDSYGI